MPGSAQRRVPETGSEGKKQADAQGVSDSQDTRISSNYPRAEK